MIRSLRPDELAACARLIRTAFGTVAEEFHITPENAPGFTAFSVTEERLRAQQEEGRPMLGWFTETGELTGFYSLAALKDGACELNNLCVLPGSRHQGVGEALLQDALARAKALGYRRMELGIVEENQVLRAWYEANGFTHTGTKKFDFFPFTCGYLQQKL